MVRPMSKDQVPTEPFDPENEFVEQTDFGFATVPTPQKAGMVRGVFDSVAGSYDAMNDVMSLGVHRAWKDSFVAWLDPRPGQRFLDVAGGTGDIAFRILDRLAARAPTETPGHVVVSDINREMLRQGMRRAEGRHGLSPDLWLCADAETLPLPDASVDAYTIAFGIRNVTHIERALDEARRVLRPGGRFLCLEFSHPVLPGLDRLYDFYSFRIIPNLGQLVARDRDSYRYLVESIRRFPDQARFSAMIEEAGLERVSIRNLSGGIAAIHSAWKL